MAFEATKKEWCELYTFFRLLADGRVALGTAEAKVGDIFLSLIHISCCRRRRCEVYPVIRS